MDEIVRRELCELHEVMMQMERQLVRIAQRGLAHQLCRKRVRLWEILEANKPEPEPEPVAVAAAEDKPRKIPRSYQKFLDKKDN